MRNHSDGLSIQDRIIIGAKHFSGKKKSEKMLFTNQKIMI